VDEPGLLHARDHLDVDAGLALGPGEQHLAVLGLAHRAGGHRAQRCAEAVGDAAEAVEGGHGPVDGVGGQLLHVGGARSEAHHLLLAAHHLEAVAVGGAGHHEVQRVGAHVDGGKGLGHGRAG